MLILGTNMWFNGTIGTSLK